MACECHDFYQNDKTPKKIFEQKVIISIAVILLKVIMLSVVMLSVVTPIVMGSKLRLCQDKLECFTPETLKPSSNILLMKATTVVALGLTKNPNYKLIETVF